MAIIRGKKEDKSMPHMDSRTGTDKVDTLHHFANLDAAPFKMEKSGVYLCIGPCCELPTS